MGCPSADISRGRAAPAEDDEAQRVGEMNKGRKDKKGGEDGGG